MKITRKATHVFIVKVFDKCSVTINAKTRDDAAARGAEIERDINSLTFEHIARFEEVGRIAIGKVQAEFCPAYMKLREIRDEGNTLDEAFKKLYPDIPEWIIDHAFGLEKQTNFTFELFQGFRVRTKMKPKTKGYHVLKMVSQVRKMRGLTVNFDTFGKKQDHGTGQSKSAQAQRQGGKSAHPNKSSWRHNDNLRRSKSTGVSAGSVGSDSRQQTKNIHDAGQSTGVRSESPNE